MSRRVSVIKQSLGTLCKGHAPDEECGTMPVTVSRTSLAEFVDLCRCVFFPEYTRLPVNFAAHNRHAHMEQVLDKIATLLHTELYNGLRLLQYDRTLEHMHDPKKGPAPVLKSDTELASIAEDIVTQFMTTDLRVVRDLLLTDTEALLTHDVAAETISEIVLCYPGLLCMLHQRIAHSLHKRGAPTNVTRMLTEMAHSLTGIDIHPHTSIGHHFFVDHGTGIVIGQTAIIGNHVSIFQGVTLGARSFPVDATGRRVRYLPRHPIIEDHVTIYSNAVVLGRIRIGRGTTIAGNAFVTKDIPPNSIVKGSTAQVVRNANPEILFHENGSGI